MNEFERLLRDEIEQSERTKDDDLPSDAHVDRPGRPGSVMKSVRIELEVADELDRLAKDRDAPVSTVIRGFIVQGLAATRETSMTRSLDKIDAQVRAMRGIIGR